jgi:prepilin-type N-terminal cleavage/methylation domain-containing protein
MFNKNEQGLTLIEMMLVVTVIAVATLSTMKILRTRTSSTQIDQIAIQMQNVGQGVINYYMLNNTWPTTSTRPSSLLSLTEGGANPVFFSPQTLCTPFSDKTQNSALCKRYALIQGQALNSTNYYQVVLKADSENAALAIANQLPDATVNGTLITMSVLAPAQNFLRNSNQGWIVAAGVISFTASSENTSNNLSPGYFYLQPGTPVILPNCPAGFESHVLFIPFFYYGGEAPPISSFYISQPGIESSYYTPINTIPGFNGNSNVYNASLPPQNLPPETSSTGVSSDVYAVHIADYLLPQNKNPSLQDYKNKGYYLTFCLPLGHWATSGIDPNSVQDGQCAVSSSTPTSWVDFLETANPTTQPSDFNCGSLIGQNNAILSSPIGSPDAY